MVIMMYICCGNFCFIWIVEGGYGFVVEMLFGKLNIDGFFLEYDNECFGDFVLLKNVICLDLKIVLGLIIFKIGELEDEVIIKVWIEEVSGIVFLS